ncbi:hypothetical protein BU24DRAFT_346506 [Aaosphaeria arxii CBS 175.79]|uniref:PH domain-containing protein n=1 Tax=Aaosphaeria arxii CBS 175.79 TaxID=1450172 RepID=A0A6A5XRQ6_9PLEO|nr:uncharacterized protein BU24DRAFT_346506 [Aaosphaeria arxii CBS 175.79]KAF2015431.1 hypothetical protein BU24DRAFT_346506 [Aaosphaeria arxii CBS 175.79]
MATTLKNPSGAFAADENNGSDPFLTTTQDTQRQRYSAFDASQFSLYLDGSPEQARRALQAHLSETTRRLQETSQLGNALVQQRKELEERLKEVEKQHEDNDIGPELRQRLAELEKEFHEVGRETARTFLPKSRVSSGEAPDSTVGASVYSSEAQHSPTKVSVPSRKQRNQQPSRVNDIALATEISTSLLSQLRDLQAVLLEKEEALKAVDLDRSQLEVEVEGLSQRLRTLDESESRLKDVNWNLETQVREFEAQSKASADKEHRLNHTLNQARTEKAALEREVEEVKQLYAKLQNDHVFSAKHHETELSGLRRNVSMGETERGALQRKLEELATQNQDLARAVAYRVRNEDLSTADEGSADDGAEEGDTITPEHSPPPSPSKATPRHGQLESETLKHSLHHAHRMIQQLKNNIHREKTEKIELKRMLQDARDELETNRSALNGPGSASKRRKNDKDVFKKPARPDRLGALRTDSHEVIDDEEWEEHDGHQQTPSRKPRGAEPVPGAFPSGFSSAAESGTDAFETANETSDAFETANERDGTTTETDAFQTGAETLDGDSSDDLTETEAGPSGTVRIRRPTTIGRVGRQNSIQSTASTSADEEDLSYKTPSQSQQQRYKMKFRQPAGRKLGTPRSSQDLFADTPPGLKDSPASFISDSRNSTPAQGKSLFAELGNLSGESEDGSVADGTPSRSLLLSPESSPDTSRRSVRSRSPLTSDSSSTRIEMVDSGHTQPQSPVPQSLGVSQFSSQDTVPVSPPRPTLQISSFSTNDTVPVIPEQAMLEISSFSAQDTTPDIPTPPTLAKSSLTAQGTSPVAPHRPLHLSQVSTQDTEPKDADRPLHLSQLSSQDTAPVFPVPPSLKVSTLSSQGTDPLSPVVETIVPPSLNVSTISHQGTDPVEPTVPALPSNTLLSSVAAQGTEPLEATTSNANVAAAIHHDRSIDSTEIIEEQRGVPLQLSSLSSQASLPHEPSRPSLSRSAISSSYATDPSEAVPRPQLSKSTVTSSYDSEPFDAPKPAAPQLSVISHQATEPVEAALPPQSQLSVHSTLFTEPIEAAKPPKNQLAAVSSLYTEPIEVARPAHPKLSALSSQFTEPVEPPKPAPSRISIQTSQATRPVEPPRRPLPQFSALSVQQTIPIQQPQVQNRFSNVMVLQNTQPESPTLPAFLPSPSRPSTANRDVPHGLSYSNVHAQETTPETQSRPTTAHRSVPPVLAAFNAGQSASESSGYFGSVPSVPENTANEARGTRAPLSPISANATSQDRDTSSTKPHLSVADEGTQTMVSAEQMEKLFALRVSQRNSTIAGAAIERTMSPPASPRRNSNEQRVPRRPGSSSSIRSRIGDAPPLPADHREVIAAAALKVPSRAVTPPTSSGSMGPPGMPASAYKKRPQTPTLKTNLPATPKTGGTTPRPRYATQRGDTGRSGASSPAITHRSSMSSFTSEVEQRFQPHANPLATSAFDPQTTDPRMIQAITQTMIGEFLWKYTRKAGSGNMSEKRHRRFFWVHPYTRTLYWSEQDPASAGRAQLKAKSVAIMAVEVVTDDNPYPPGLHRKSLVVHTPGRSIQFTATTSQRHETWFNALSYLLMRVDEGQNEQHAGTDEIQNEFNPTFRSMSRQTGRSKASMSSHYSRRPTSPHHAQIPTLRPASASQQRAASTEPGQERPSGRLSSLSGKFRDSFSSRRSRTNGVATYEQPERDSRLDMAEQMAEQSMQEDQLINVRACCDGKHDVGHLHTLKARHSSFTRASLTASMNSRSQSRTSTRQDHHGEA